MHELLGDDVVVRYDGRLTVQALGSDGRVMIDAAPSDLHAVQPLVLVHRAEDGELLLEMAKVGAAGILAVTSVRFLYLPSGDRIWHCLSTS